MQGYRGPAHGIKDTSQLGNDQEHRAHQPIYEKASNSGFAQVRAFTSTGVPQQSAECQQGGAKHPGQGDAEGTGFHPKGTKQGAGSDNEPQRKDQLNNKGNSEQGSHTIPPLNEWLIGPSDKGIYYKSNKNKREYYKSILRLAVMKTVIYFTWFDEDVAPQ